MTVQLGTQTLENSASPEDIGLSTAALEHMERRLVREVDEAAIHGFAAAVVRAGSVGWLCAHGTRDGVDSMHTDAIFRIYSMTKPLTSIAVMLLYEEGRLLLADPVAAHLPALANPTVLVDGRIVAADRDITVHDLLLHTSGLAGGVHGTHEIMARYAEAEVLRYDHTRAANAFPVSVLVQRLGEIPLANHPGTVWEYSRAADVLGHLVEVISGESLDAFCASRIFTPLGLVDTGWHVDADSIDRLAGPAPTPGQHLPDLVDPLAPPTLLSGGSGAFSTVSDYVRVAQMLLEGGRGPHGRILGRKTVELMTRDHLGTRSGTGPDYIPGCGYGFGLGFAVRTGAGTYPGSRGDYWWLGRAGTSFFVDPAEELIGVLMLQKYERAVQYQQLFRALVYQAIR
jgi:CubicO group peptidase (beta-lactamase class C family)